MKLGRVSVVLMAIGLGLYLTGCGSDSNSATTEVSDTFAYTDYKGETRTAYIDPGRAETLAGVGYEHTLLDSADAKCQHCHNELYDTWKTSMHAKSWSDKIFQSKHQDFLRVHISKIGTNPTGDKEYTTAVFKGAAKTCAKCHAPAAIYSGDYQVDIEQIDTNGTIATTAEFLAAKAAYEVNLAGATDYSPHTPTTIVATSSKGEIYKATYHIGNAHNREGINCATCHSIETVRMMRSDGADNGEYTLAKDLRVGPHGPIKKAAGETLLYSADGTELDMNYFFRLWGPEIYSAYHNTPKSAGEFDLNKTSDGRYTMKSIDINATDGKVHYTGGPFYGPFGVTGLANTNADDESNRTAQLNPHFDKDTNNHFGDFGKGLCLSCHQRSSGAYTPDNNGFMELCSTWLAVSDGVDNNYEDSITSPKCQKCHMPRLEEKTVLHQWGKPDALFTQADTHLTAHFDPESNTTDATNNPVKGEWMNDHAFVGGSKIGSTNYKAKIQSGFDASVSAQSSGSSIAVTTTLENKTAHMFPGAHPMRRVFTRVVVTDTEGNIVNMASAAGNSTFDTIENSVVSGNAADSVDSTGEAVVTVGYDASRVIDFPGIVPDLDGSGVLSQKFNGEIVTIVAADSTVTEQNLTDTGVIQGKVKNAAIAASSDMSNFTRIYGHETGKTYDGTFVVRPGFDSNVVASDNRLLPNEKETYTINYTGLADGEYTVTYKVYYMQKGANGTFPTAADGFLDNDVNIEKKLLITEVGSYDANVTVSSTM